MKNEPLIIRGAVVAAVNALIGMLVAFGVNMTPEQVQSINTFIDLASIAVLVAWGRAAVTPNGKVEALVADAQTASSEEVISEVPEEQAAASEDEKTLRSI